MSGRAVRADGAGRASCSARSRGCARSATTAPRSRARPTSPSICASTGSGPSRWQGSICRAGSSPSTAPSRCAPRRCGASPRPSRPMASTRRRLLSRLRPGRGDAAGLGRPARRRCRPPRRSAARRLQRSSGDARREASDDAHTLVGCGAASTASASPSSIRTAGRRLAARPVGEVWVAGPHVAQGYWRNAGGDRGDLRGAHRGRRRGDAGCAPAISASSTSRRALHHRAHQGRDHHPRHQPLSRRTSRTRCRRAIPRCAAMAAPPLPCPARMAARSWWSCRRWSARSVTRSIVDEIADCIREAVANEHELAVQEIVLIRAGPSRRPPAARSSAARRASSGSRACSRRRTRAHPAPTGPRPPARTHSCHRGTCCRDPSLGSLRHVRMAGSRSRGPG